MRISFDSTSYLKVGIGLSSPRFDNVGDPPSFHRDRITFHRRVSAWNAAQAKRDLRATYRWADRVARANPSTSFRLRMAETANLPPRYRAETAKKFAQAQLDLLDLGATPAQVGGWQAVKAAEAVA